MKSKDWTVIFMVAVVSAVISILLSNSLITSNSKNQTAEVVEAITPEFNRPDSTYFNDKSINPAQEIEIGRDPSSNPFRGR